MTITDSITLIEETAYYRLLRRGNCLSLEPLGNWSEHLYDVIKAWQISHLHVTYVNGCYYDDTSFLAPLPNLSGIDLVQLGNTDLGGLTTLRTLKQLRLNIYGKAKVDLSFFSELHRLDVLWKNGYTHLERCKQLERLAVLSPAMQVHESIRELEQLGELVLFGSGRTDLRFVPDSVWSLRLTRCAKLNDISRLPELPSLKELWVQECAGFSSVEAVAECARLESVIIEDVKCINTLKPLLKLTRLRTLVLSTRETFSLAEIEAVANSPIARVAVIHNGRPAFERQLESAD